MNFQKTETVTKALQLRVVGETPPSNHQQYAGLQQWAGPAIQGRPATPADLQAVGYVAKADVRRITESAVQNAIAAGFSSDLADVLATMLEQLEVL